MGLFAVTTRSNMEDESVDAVIENSGNEIHAAIAPNQLNGYIFVEADSRSSVETAASRSGYINKVVQGEVGMGEIESFLSPSSDVDEVSPGDLVEVTEGAYEGKEARVTNVNSTDETVTVELEDEPIQIPIELPGSHVRAA